jgi:hypothetical protein
MINCTFGIPSSIIPAHYMKKEKMFIVAFLNVQEEQAYTKYTGMEKHRLAMILRNSVIFKFFDKVVCNFKLSG